MSSLKADFNELMERIKQGREFGHASFEPIFYLVFPPHRILDVKRETPAWIHRLRNDGWEVATFSMTEAVADLIERAPLRKIWLAADRKAPLSWDKTNAALANAIGNGALRTRIEARLAELDGKPRAILLVTDLEALHPYTRIGVIEGNLQGKFQQPVLFQRKTQRHRAGAQPGRATRRRAAAHRQRGPDPGLRAPARRPVARIPCRRHRPEGPRGRRHPRVPGGRAQPHPDRRGTGRPQGPRQCADAAHRLAEKFLRVGQLSAITSALDPLTLVHTHNGRPGIRTDHLAMVSIRDYLDHHGALDGKRLTEIFAEAPFGWSPDTLRYLIAAMLLAGDIKLKVAGRDVTVNGQQAIDALKTNNAFKSVGISLRDGDRPSNDSLARAAARLTELTGDTVVPLEDDISKAAARLLPRLQHHYGPLAEKLRGLDLPGVDRLRQLAQDMHDVLLTDASDAPRRLGNDPSDLFDSLKWAAEVKLALEQGLERTLRDLRQHSAAIANLPNVERPAQLKNELAETLGLIDERLRQADFHRFAADFSTSLTTIRARIRDTVLAMRDQLKIRIRAAQLELERVPEWRQLTPQEQAELLGDLERLLVEPDPDLAGLAALLNKDYELQSRVRSLKGRIEQRGRQRIREELEPDLPPAAPPGADAPEHRPTLIRNISANARLTRLSDLDALIAQLQQVRGELQAAHAFIVKLELRDD